MFPSEDTDFTVLHIAAGRLRHSRCPLLFSASYKNIYRIAFYGEILQFLSTNSCFEQNIYSVLKLQGNCKLKIGLAAYLKNFTVGTHIIFFILCKLDFSTNQLKN